jgi:hypothetical protein
MEPTIASHSLYGAVSGIPLPKDSRIAPSNRVCFVVRAPLREKSWRQLWRIWRNFLKVVGCSFSVTVTEPVGVPLVGTSAQFLEYAPQNASNDRRDRYVDQQGKLHLPGAEKYSARFGARPQRRAGEPKDEARRRRLPRVVRTAGAASRSM